MTHPVGRPPIRMAGAIKSVWDEVFNTPISLCPTTGSRKRIKSRSRKMPRGRPGFPIKVWVSYNEALAHRIEAVYLRDWRVILAFLQKDNAAMQEEWSWAGASRKLTWSDLWHRMMGFFPKCRLRSR